MCEISSDRRSPDGRKILAEIKLPLDQGPDPQVRSWLVEELGHLNLQAGFIRRILDSARDAMERLSASEGRAVQRGQVHVLISGPQRAGTEGETWGFFRIEKLEGTAPGDVPPDHSIEFYLYVEKD